MMTSLMWLFPSIMVMVGVFVFVSARKHLLSMLLSLEYMVLFLFFLMFLVLSMTQSDMYIIVMFLTFSVCEGALGLSILVSMIRSHGNDMFQSFSVLQC